jgi:hypothetical protein
MKVCGGCGGSRWVTLGILGNLKHRRCRLCGLQVAVKVAPRRKLKIRDAIGASAFHTEGWTASPLRQEKLT